MEQNAILYDRKIIAMVCALAAMKAAEDAVDYFGTPEDFTRVFHAVDATLAPEHRMIPDSNVYVIVDQYGNEDGYLETRPDLGRFAYGIVTG